MNYSSYRFEDDWNRGNCKFYNFKLYYHKGNFVSVFHIKSVYVKLECCYLDLNLESYSSKLKMGRSLDKCDQAKNFSIKSYVDLY